MTRTYKDYLIDMYDAAVKVSEFIESLSFSDFKNDEKTIFAVIRAIEIMGEASKKIPPSVRKGYPAIPWKELAGMRDKLIHEYFGADMKVVWKAATEELPPLELKLKEIVDKL